MEWAPEHGLKDICRAQRELASVHLCLIISQQPVERKGSVPSQCPNIQKGRIHGCIGWACARTHARASTHTRTHRLSVLAQWISASDRGDSATVYGTACLEGSVFIVGWQDRQVTSRSTYSCPPNSKLVSEPGSSRVRRFQDHALCEVTTVQTRLHGYGAGARG